MTTPQKHAITEAATVTLNSDDFRRVASELHRAVNVAAEALNNKSADERDRLRAIVDAASTGLFSLAIGQIRRVPR
jgi:predicted HAD superfamily Cof-like phosphohydrolase